MSGLEVAAELDLVDASDASEFEYAFEDPSLENWRDA